MPGGTSRADQQLGFAVAQDTQRGVRFSPSTDRTDSMLEPELAQGSAAPESPDEKDPVDVLIQEWPGWPVRCV